jgi:hypothetical protein
MEKQKSRRKWIISAATIAIIVPISLAILSLNGFFSSQAVAENITAEAVTWEIERPLSTIPLKELVRNTYTDGEGASITLNLLVGHYIEDFDHYGGADFISIRVNVSASVSNGFVKSVYVVFEENHTGSQVDWFELNALYDEYTPFPQGLYIRHNLCPEDHLQMVSTSGVKAYLRLSGLNQPKSILFLGPAHWVLRSNHNQTHALDCRVELTYYNNTHYVKTVLPIEIVVWADAGNSFETARTISFGNHTGFIQWGDDPEDYYKIRLENGQAIQVMVYPVQPYAGIDFDLYLYNPNLNQVANATEEEIELDMLEEIRYTAEVSGCWYIRVVNSYASRGWYQLSVNINESETS